MWDAKSGWWGIGGRGVGVSPCSASEMCPHTASNLSFLDLAPQANEPKYRTLFSSQSLKNECFHHELKENYFRHEKLSRCELYLTNMQYMLTLLYATVYLY